MFEKWQWLHGTLGFLSRLVTSLTLEPALLVYNIGEHVEIASGLPSKLLLDKGKYVVYIVRYNL